MRAAASSDALGIATKYMINANPTNRSRQIKTPNLSDSKRFTLCIPEDFLHAFSQSSMPRVSETVTLEPSAN